jgi:uncharacterized protein YmfQ (DUF2313 family)
MKLFNPHSQEEHRKSLADFLPNGPAFGSKNDSDANLFKFLNGLSLELQRVENTFNLLAEEYGINETTLLIDSWEKAVGIPDDCFSISSTIEERRRNVLIKLTLSIDTRKSFYDLAALLGVTNIIIRNGGYNGVFPLRFPAMFFPDVKTAKYTMIVELPASLGSGIFGVSKFPFPFINGAASLIECLFRALRPAHYDIKFLYILE